MKNYFYLAGLGLILTSCGGDSAATDGNSDTTKTDTVAVSNGNIDIDENALLAKFTSSGALPFVQDSVFLENLALNDTNVLAADEVKYLSFNFIETEVSYQGPYPVNDFLFLDSLKEAGAYEDYTANADIGITVTSDAYVAHKVKVDDSTDVLLWVIDYSTVEACPYAAGKILYGTVMRNGIATSCTVLGESSGGADAPVWGNTLSLVSMTDDGYSIFRTDENCEGETDEDGNEVISVTMLDFMVSIDPAGNWKEEPTAVTAGE